jgi:phage terminase large subunit-like protein
MARLTTADKVALKALAKKGWIQSAEERSPLFVEPTLEANERYCRWVAGVSKVVPAEKPVRFTGSDWKL